MLLALHSGRVQAAFNLENGQLVSLRHKEKELFHGGGKPPALQTPEDAGWNNSEIVMFPVIGPVKENRLRFNGREYPMAQHGLSRHLPWSIAEQRTDAITFIQQYEAETPVQNNKIADYLRWPFSYRLEKRFALTPQGVRVVLGVVNESDEPMPYSIGWHPAFRLLDREVAGRLVSDVQESRAVEMDAAATYFGDVRISTDLPYLTLWSPKGSQLLCIEPMSRLQVWEGFERFDNDFVLDPGERREHVVEIRIV